VSVVEHLFGDRSVIGRLYRLTTPGDARDEVSVKADEEFLLHPSEF
jgi:hypothetical protein